MTAAASANYVFIPESDLPSDRRHDVSVIFGEGAGKVIISSRAVLTEVRDSWPGCRVATIHHDPIRRGYFVVREGTRYIAVKGVVAGQWSWGTRGDEGRIDGMLKALREGRQTLASCGSFKTTADPDVVTIIDLHNLGGTITPRYAGESVPAIHQWSRIADCAYSCACGAEVVALPNGDLGSLNFPSDACEQAWLAYDAARIAAYPPVEKINWLNGATDAQIVNRLAAKREAIRTVTPTLWSPFPTNPARVCAAWDMMHRWREQRLAGDTSTPPPFTMGWWAPESEDHPRVILKSVRIDGVLVTADDYTRARSLLLAVRAETSPGPVVVVCEGDHPLDADNMLIDASSTVSSWAERLLPRELRS